MDKRIYYLYVVCGASLWGLISLFTYSLADCGISPGNIVVIRSFGASALLFAIFFIKDRTLIKINIRDIKYFIGTGIISFVLFNYCLFTSMKTCSAAISVVLLYTAPIFVMLMSAILFKEKMTAQKICALILAVAGCVLVTGITGSINGTPFGLICGLGSGFFYALYSIFGRYALEKYRPVTVTLYTFLFAAIGSVPLIRFNELCAGLSQPKGIINTVLIVCISTVSPFLLYTKGLSGIESGTASILATAEPAVGVMVSVFILRQPLTVSGIIGILLILLGVIAININIGRKENELQRKA